MATYLENLTTARDNFAAKLAEVSANPKPSYSAPNGQSFNWVEYMRFLQEQVDKLNAQLSAQGGPWEEVAEGIT
jgi:hypothetical protein